MYKVTQGCVKYTLSIGVPFDFIVKNSPQSKKITLALLLMLLTNMRYDFKVIARVVFGFVQYKKVNICCEAVIYNTFSISFVSIITN